MPKIHKLKLRKEYVDDVVKGRKTFEFRLNDRDYQVGDYIAFTDVEGNPYKEFDKSFPFIRTKQDDGSICYSDWYRQRCYKITYILKLDDFLESEKDKQYVVLSIKQCKDSLYDIEKKLKEVEVKENK